MCKRCSHHVDLRDYHITSAVSKNFRTKGLFVVEEKGNVFNTEVLVGDAIIKGKFLGKLVAERSLTVYNGAQIKGSFKTGRLIVPAGNGFAWKDTLAIGGAEISGELVANVKTGGTVWLKSTARLFGDVEATNLVVEAGAVIVGAAIIGVVPAPAAPSAAFPAGEQVKADNALG
jgi:cytoskeletal protein CcmA (bactofilin family)